MTQRRDRSALVYVQRFNVKAGLPHLEVRSIVFFVSLLMMVGLAGWLYLHQASEVAVSVQQIRKLQDENASLQQEVLALYSDVAMLGSLKHVQELAASQGYQPPQSAEPAGYLVLPYAPQTRAVATATGPESAIQEQALAHGEQSKGLGRQLLDQLMTWLGSRSNE